MQRRRTKILMVLILFLTLIFRSNIISFANPQQNTLQVSVVVGNDSEDNTPFNITLLKNQGQNYVQNRQDTVAQGNQKTIILDNGSGNYRLEIELNGYQLVNMTPSNSFNITGNGNRREITITVTRNENGDDNQNIQKVTPVEDTQSQVSATAVTIGQTLASSTLSGTFKHPNSDEIVIGTLAWTNPTAVVNATGDFGWTFTPTNSSLYNTITGTVRVVANPGSVLPVDPIEDTEDPVSATALTVGQTLASSTLSGIFKDPNTDDAVPGTLAWTNPTAVVNATGNFEWTFTPENLDEYNIITGNIEVVANPISNPPVFIYYPPVVISQVDEVEENDEETESEVESFEDEEIIVLDEEIIPIGVTELPKTGERNQNTYYIIGLILLLVGITMKREAF